MLDDVVQNYPALFLPEYLIMQSWMVLLNPIAYGISATRRRAAKQREEPMSLEAIKRKRLANTVRPTLAWSRWRSRWLHDWK